MKNEETTKISDNKNVNKIKTKKMKNEETTKISENKDVNKTETKTMIKKRFA